MSLVGTVGLLSSNSHAIELRTLGWAFVSQVSIATMTQTQRLPLLGSMAPHRRHDVACFGLKAATTGTLSNPMSGIIAGFFWRDRLNANIPDVYCALVVLSGFFSEL